MFLIAREAEKSKCEVPGDSASGSNPLSASKMTSYCCCLLWRRRDEHCPHSTTKMDKLNPLSPPTFLYMYNFTSYFQEDKIFMASQRPHLSKSPFLS